MRYCLLALRVLVCPVILVMLGGTALIQACYFRDGDWSYWRDFNSELIALLPWSNPC